MITKDKKERAMFAEFFAKKHVCSIATRDARGVWACNCYFVFAPEDMALVFASSEETRHMKAIQQDPEVAGTVYLDSESVAKIKGVQFRGIVRSATAAQGELYLERFPYAKTMKPKLWQIVLSYIKLTDNSSLGVGNKMHWPGPEDA